MKNVNFSIAGHQIKLDEKDYIFSKIFQVLYGRIEEQLVRYEKELDKIEQLDSSKIKYCISKYKSFGTEEDNSSGDDSSIDDTLVHNITEIRSYLEELGIDDCCTEIRQTYIISRRLIEDFFEEHDNFGITTCNVSESLWNSQNKELEKIYNRRIEAHDPKVMGMSFEQYSNSTLVADILEASSLGYMFDPSSSYYPDKLTQKFWNKTESFVEPKIDYLHKYSKVFDDMLTGYERTLEVLETLLKLKNHDNRNKWMEGFRSQCIFYILLILKDVHEKCGVSINEKYYDWNNYTKYDQIYKTQCAWNDEELKKNADEVLENLFRFPVLERQYELVLLSLGDKEGELDKFASFWGCSIQKYKKVLYNKFTEQIGRINIDDEEKVIEDIKKIAQYRDFISYYGEMNGTESKIDLKYRTVNGKVYDTREMAEEVRERSFEGKEYASKEEANLVRKEVEEIRSACANKRLLEKYEAYQILTQQSWHTKEAEELLNQINEEINREHTQLKNDADMVSKKGDELKKIYVVTEAITLCILLFFKSNIAVMAFLISALIVIFSYRNLEKMQKAQKELQEFQNVINKYSMNPILFKSENDIPYTDKNTQGRNVLSSNDEKTKNNKCGKCGYEIEQDMDFCPFCGNKLK